VRGKETRRNRVIFEQLVESASHKLQSEPYEQGVHNEPYTIGVEVRTRATGDGAGGAHDAIDKGVAQVLRGTSGLINHYYSLDVASLSRKSFRFIPAIFTTAELWVTDADLTTTDLITGNVLDENFLAKRVGWLWFNYNLSPNLQHSIPRGAELKPLAEVLTNESTRSVAIVSPAGLTEFLQIELRWEGPSQFTVTG